MKERSKIKWLESCENYKKKKREIIFEKLQEEGNFEVKQNWRKDRDEDVRGMKKFDVD